MCAITMLAITITASLNIVYRTGEFTLRGTIYLGMPINSKRPNRASMSRSMGGMGQRKCDSLWQGEGKRRGWRHTISSYI